MHVCHMIRLFIYIGGTVVCTLPIGASPVMQQQQVVSVAGGGGVGTTAVVSAPALAHRQPTAIQQQSVVLPVRTTPLGGTGAAGTFPITQVIQNPGGGMATTATVGSGASGLPAGALPQQPAPAGTIQTVKIGGQTQVINLIMVYQVFVNPLYLSYVARLEFFRG